MVKPVRKDEETMAVDLVDHYMLVVYPYLGSSYMTGTEDEELKFKSAKKEAKFLCQIMIEGAVFPYDGGICSTAYYKHLIYWKNVSAIVNNLTQEEYVRLKNS